MTEPEDIADAIIGHLKAALEEIEAVSEDLEPDEDVSLSKTEKAEA